MSMKKITPQLARAEAALVRHQKAWLASQELHAGRWRAKLGELIRSFPDDVCAGLVALQILTAGDVETADAQVKPE